MTPDVEVIIVNFNTCAELAACLVSLHEHMPRSVARVVVVDNHSTDGSADMVRSRWSGVELIELETNLGFGPANNVALRRCRHPLALLLNSDTVVTAGAIDTLRDRMLATSAVAAGPKLTDGSGNTEVSFGPMLTPVGELAQRWRQRAASRPDHWAASHLRHYLSEERFPDWVSGACLLLDVKAAAAVEFFDERYFMYEEDVDLCAALRAKGGRILYTPSATIVHLRGRSVEAARRADGSRSHYDASHLAFYKKHSPGWVPLLRLWMRLRGRRV